MGRSLLPAAHGREEETSDLLLLVTYQWFIETADRKKEVNFDIQSSQQYCYTVVTLDDICKLQNCRIHRLLQILIRSTTCLENLEMSGNLTAVRDFTENQGIVRKKSCWGKFV